MRPAPVLLFAHDRPELLARTLESLGRNDLAGVSDLTIHCDAPRSPESEKGAAAVRSLARATTGFRSVTVHEAVEHQGTDRSLVSGVTRAFEVHDRVIVVDEDLEMSPHFLAFVNQALERYADDERVVSVSGYTGPVPGPLPETYFLPGAHCWGWGTWRRGWRLFEPDARALLDQILRRRLIWQYDCEGAEPLTTFLARAIQSGESSWILRWTGSAILHDKLTLYPGGSLVRKTGMSDEGGVFDVELTDRRPTPRATSVEVDRHVQAQIRRLLIRWRSRWSWKQRLYYAVSAFLPQGMQRAVYATLVKASLRRRGVL